MYRNDIFEKKLDSLLIDTVNNKFLTVRTDSLTEQEKDYLYKKAAIGMAHLVYRNGKIEEFHAGSCKDADIPDSVMKIINKDVCNKCYELIAACGDSDEYISYMIVKSYFNSKLYGNNWDEPSLIPLMLSLIRIELKRMEEETQNEYGIELLLTNKKTRESLLMTFVFEDKENNNVILLDFDNNVFDENLYTYDAFVSMLVDNYIVNSYSIEDSQELWNSAIEE